MVVERRVDRRKRERLARKAAKAKVASEAKQSITWRDVFKPPFRLENHRMTLWSANDVWTIQTFDEEDGYSPKEKYAFNLTILMMLTMAVNNWSHPPQDAGLKYTEAREMIDDMLKVLPMPLVAPDTGEVIRDANGRDLFLARGWGELTSPACQGLDGNTAAALQDSMLKEFAEMFNKKWSRE
jgi:hypothetical protein